MSSRALRLPLKCLFGFVFLSACGKKDIDKVAEAQACLDKASADTASACAEKVEGLTSPQSYLIRCVSIYKQQGKSAAEIAAQVNNLKNTTNGSPAGSESVMSVLAFTKGANTSTNLTLAQTAREYCINSLSSGLSMLATATYMANLAIDTTAKISAACDGDLTDEATRTSCVAQGLDSLKNAPNEVKSGLGTAIVSAYNSSCTGTTAGSSNTFCKQFEDAVKASGGTADTVAIANQFLSKY